MKKVVLAALACLLAIPITGQEVHVRTLLKGYDVAATSYIYGGFADNQTTVADITSVFGPGVPKNIRVYRSGASTITAVTAGTKPFLATTIGDLLLFNLNGVPYERVITARADDQVSIDSDLDVAPLNAATGTTFRWKKRFMGSNAADGWFSVGAYGYVDIQADVTTINATSLDFTVECRTSPFAATNTLFTKNFTAAGSTAVALNIRKEQCRAGWKVNTDTGAQSVAVYILAAKE